MLCAQPIQKKHRKSGTFDTSRALASQCGTRILMKLTRQATRHGMARRKSVAKAVQIADRQTARHQTSLLPVAPCRSSSPACATIHNAGSGLPTGQPVLRHPIYMVFREYLVGAISRPRRAGGTCAPPAILPPNHQNAEPKGRIHESSASARIACATHATQLCICEQSRVIHCGANDSKRPCVNPVCYPNTMLSYCFSDIIFPG